MLTVCCHDIKLYLNLLFSIKSDHLKEHFALTFHCSEFKEQHLDPKEQWMSWLLLTRLRQAVYTPCKSNCLINLHLNHLALLPRSKMQVNCKYVLVHTKYSAHTSFV